MVFRAIIGIVFYPLCNDMPHDLVYIWKQLTRNNPYLVVGWGGGQTPNHVKTILHFTSMTYAESRLKIHSRSEAKMGGGNIHTVYLVYDFSFR